MRMTTAGYAAVIRQLMAGATDRAIAFVTEGGYDLDALGSCLDASFAAIAGDSTPADASSGVLTSSARGQRALDRVRAAQAPFWRGI
jgi:acetoin utilization deacetylase AcuC-like enzyme